MGFLDFLKGKGGEPEQAAAAFPAILGTPAQGAFMAMNQIPDEVFSAGVLGICCGVEPDTGNVYAPIGAKVTRVADTLHAIGLEAGGIELLLTMDLGRIRAAGHPATVVLAVNDADDFASVEPLASGAVQPGDDVLRVNR